MNDEFLYRLRKDPPLSYALRLKEKLRQQDAATAAPVRRRRPALRTLLAVFLVGGSALAATLLAVKGPASFVEMLRPDADAPSAAPATPQGVQQKSTATQRQVRDVPINSFVTPASNQAESSASPGVSGGDATGADKGAQAGPSAAGPMIPGAPSSQPQGAVQASAARGAIDILATPSGHEIIKSGARRARVMADITTFINTADNSTAVRALCDLNKPERPDIAITSRPMTEAETAQCKQMGTHDVVEAKFGYRAVVVTRARTGPEMELSARDLFLAVARRVPASGNSRTLIDNPYNRWNQINPALEPWQIQVWGPGEGSPVWGAFVEIILEAGCDSYAWIAALKNSDRAQYDDICHTVRADRMYSEVRQINILVEQSMLGEPNAVVVLDYGFYDRNRQLLLGSLLGGAAPTRESIVDGTYPGARPLYLVVARNPGVQSFAVMRFRQLFLREISSGLPPFDDALIPLDPDARRALQETM